MTKLDQWRAQVSEAATKPIRFTIIHDFYEKELKSHYLKGMSYTLKPGNKLLAKHLKTWVEDGLAALDDSVTHAVIRGIG